MHFWTWIVSDTEFSVIRKKHVRHDLSSNCMEHVSKPFIHRYVVSAVRKLTKEMEIQVVYGHIFVFIPIF